MTIAIITGASSGLGREYVRAVAEMMPMLDEIWLIARRKTQLVGAGPVYRWPPVPHSAL